MLSHEHITALVISVTSLDMTLPYQELYKLYAAKKNNNKINKDTLPTVSKEETDNFRSLRFTHPLKSFSPLED